MQRDGALYLRPVGFIDDDPFLQGRRLGGLRVLGDVTHLGSVIRKHRIEAVVFASERIAPDRRSAAMHACGASGIGIYEFRVVIQALSPRVTPIFWAHGLKDLNIPFELATRGRERLEGAGVPLSAHDYDVGHWIVPEEVTDALAFVDSLED